MADLSNYSLWSPPRANLSLLIHNLSRTHNIYIIYIRNSFQFSSCADAVLNYVRNAAWWWSKEGVSVSKTAPLWRTLSFWNIWAEIYDVFGAGSIIWNHMNDEIKYLEYYVGLPTMCVFSFEFCVVCTSMCILSLLTF